jgi:hypothetical protein
LHAKSKRADQERRGVVAFRMGKNHLHVAGDLVGDCEFFESADGKQAEAALDILPRGTPALEHLREQVRGAHDRSGDELWEKGDEEQEVLQLSARLNVTAVHVDRVAHALKGEERDARGQHSVEDDCRDFDSDEREQ